jgi:hypothetical protein
MKIGAGIALAAVLMGTLAACGGGTSSPAPQAPTAQPQPSPFPDVGMSADVSDAVVSACRRVLEAQTDGEVQVVGSEFSEANVLVYMVVGPQRAPWRCFTGNDASYADVEFMGSEGAL